MTLTADQVFDAVIALMFAEDAEKSDYQVNFIRHLNMKLAESFKVNNSLRRMRGLEDLPEVPRITLLTDEIPYEYELTYDLLPVGVAGYLYVDDDETGISNEYRQRWTTGLAGIGQAEFVEVIPDGYYTTDTV